MPHEFECFQEGCTFSVRADTADEVVHLVQTHAQYNHGLELDREAIEGEIRPT
jgi:predicted small metal-binding protein